VIDQVDRQLGDWARGVFRDVTVVFDLRASTQAPSGVALHLTELLEEPPPRGPRRPPLQLLLRYLVSCWAERTEDAHKLLGELAFAAMENPEFRVDLTPASSEFWRACALPPRPSFFLCVPCRLERERKPAALVRGPIVIKATGLSPLDGQVLGPDDIPVMGARVEVPTLGLVSRTDFRGHFHFASIPMESPLVLHVNAKGREIAVKTERAPDSKAPLIIHVPNI
jgi:hypothetical protein